MAAQSPTQGFDHRPDLGREMSGGKESAQVLDAARLGSASLGKQATSLVDLSSAGDRKRHEQGDLVVVRRESVGLFQRRSGRRQIAGGRPLL